MNAEATLVALALLAALAPIPVDEASAQEAALFEDGVISTVEEGEAFPFISPDGNEFYFSTHSEGWSFHTLYMSSLTDGVWTEPIALAFSGTYSDRAPRLSPDGDALYFSSNRPLQDHPPGDYNIWVVHRAAGGSWSQPEPLPASVNSRAHEYHAVITRDGELYFSRVTDARRDKHDIFVSVLGDNGFGEATKVGPPISDGYSQPDIYVNPAGDIMILVITDHPEGFGGDDLYVSYRRGGVWTVPVNLGPGVNTAKYDYGPSISPDHEWLLFTRHDRGLGDVYAVRLEEIDIE